MGTRGPYSQVGSNRCITLPPLMVVVVLVVVMMIVMVVRGCNRWVDDRVSFTSGISIIKIIIIVVM